MDFLTIKGFPVHSSKRDSPISTPFICADGSFPCKGEKLHTYLASLCEYLELVKTVLFLVTCFLNFFLKKKISVAQTNKGKDAHPLLGKCWQSPSVSERTTGASWKHGIPRYRGWESQTNSWPYLDDYIEIPGKDKIIFGKDLCWLHKVLQHLCEWVHMSFLSKFWKFSKICFLSKF